MKYKKIKLKLTVSLLLTTFCLTTNAQGVVFYKKDGTKLKVPYENLDSISTYERRKKTPINENQKKEFNINGVKFTMIPVKAGTFQMGNADGLADERPVHTVTLTDDYYIGETEVTQELWDVVYGRVNTLWLSKYGRGGNYPVYYVGYEEVLTFIKKLNNLTGETFCLPTEAEWEFAAKGGNKSRGFTFSGSNTLKDVGWWSASSIHKVKSFAPNELGIYDMSGNIGEFCSDWYDNNYYESSTSINPMGPSTGSFHVVRGGSWISSASGCCTTHRYKSLPPIQVGFRLVLK